MLIPKNSLSDKLQELAELWLFEKEMLVIAAPKKTIRDKDLDFSDNVVSTLERSSIYS